ncbi:hypothetical protein V1478_008246 [Vespula squamosa]|uniref:Uncharacterized protein n=1 Tax=Vespula squamosa TaxID=30214 RepID=A0ABD2AY98_VESSQ
MRRRDLQRGERMRREKRNEEKEEDEEEEEEEELVKGGEGPSAAGAEFKELGARKNVGYSYSSSLPRRTSANRSGLRSSTMISIGVPFFLLLGVYSERGDANVRHVRECCRCEGSSFGRVRGGQGPTKGDRKWQEENARALPGGCRLLREVLYESRIPPCLLQANSKVYHLGIPST